jgi:transposase
MSLHPEPLAAVPEETAHVARAAFPQGNLYMRMRDEIGVIFADEAFAPLFSPRGQPAEAPWRLALVTVMQYAEGLPDRQAADAVRSRIDWKYALNLELTDPGFDHTVLSEFRARLLTGSAEHLLLDTLLQVCRERKLLKARGRQRTDSTHVLAAIRVLNRLECVGETLRHALNSLAVVAPQWVQTHCPAEWVERYGPRVENYRLPASKAERGVEAERIGRDGHALLAALYAADAPRWLREIPAVETLRQVWVQQYYLMEETVQWRSIEDHGIPPAHLFINSPYDPDAHCAAKRSTQWVGYRVHLSETCDEDCPRLITHVETTAAPTADNEALSDIHAALTRKDLLPRTHLLDSGYIAADLLVETKKDYAVDLCGPPRANYHWQAQAATGFAASDFTIDWQRQQAICPLGHTSSTWRPTIDRRGNAVISIKFALRDCRPCPHRPDCTRTTLGRRMLTIRPREQFEALQQARARQKTEGYKKEYAQRAGAEGTISQAVGVFGLRRARYFGLLKTHLQHVLTATALNFVRISEWLAGTPLAKTRKSAFMRLMEQPMTA